MVGTLNDMETQLCNRNINQDPLRRVLVICSFLEDFTIPDKFLNEVIKFYIKEEKFYYVPRLCQKQGVSEQDTQIRIAEFCTELGYECKKADMHEKAKMYFSKAIDSYFEAEDDDKASAALKELNLLRSR